MGSPLKYTYLTNVIVLKTMDVHCKHTRTVGILRSLTTYVTCIILNTRAKEGFQADHEFSGKMRFSLYSGGSALPVENDQTLKLSKIKRSTKKSKMFTNPMSGCPRRAVSVRIRVRVRLGLRVGVLCAGRYSRDRRSPVLICVLPSHNFVYFYMRLYSQSYHISS